MAAKHKHPKPAAKASETTEAAPSKPAALPIDLGTYDKQFRLAFIIISALMFVLVPLSSLKVGIPADEPIDMQYGQLSYQFYTSGGADTSFTNVVAYNGQVTRPKQQFYGALFETLTVAVNKMFGGNIYKLRHVMTALVGCLMFWLIGLTLKDIGGWLAGLVGLLLILFTPSLFGQVLFNTKDTPFAMGFVLTMFAMLRIVRGLPTIKRSHLVLLALGMMVAIGVRIGGILLIGYCGLTYLLALWFNKDSSFHKKDYKQLFLQGGMILGTLLVGMLLGLFGYPRFWLHPFTHVQETLALMSNFNIPITILYDGKLIKSTQIPQSYIPNYLWMTIPFLVWMGIGAFVAWGIKDKLNRLAVIMLLFCFLFPPAYVVSTKAPVYNGWRHVMFAIPFMIAVGALGWYYLLQFATRSKAILAGAGLVLLGGILNLAWWTASNHPYEYIYFNMVNGGVSGAYGKYDLDYQNLATYECMDWVTEHYNIDKTDTNIVFGTNNLGAMYHSLYKNPKISYNQVAFRALYFTDWDYVAMAPLFITPETYPYVFPPKESVYEARVEGVPLAFVAKRDHKMDMKAMQLMQQQNLQEACPLLIRSYQLNDRKISIYPMVAHCLIASNQKDKAEILLNAYLKLYPGDKYARQLMGSLSGGQ